MTQKQFGWWLLLILLAGSFIRLHGIADQVVIDDEWHALNAVQNHDFKWILTHFGNSDHSIPLALLYEIEYHTVGLSEVLMRWPMLLAGCLTLVLIPHMLRHWMNRPERLLLAALLAISPLLIYYSRFARPYSLLVLLESGALVMAWHWWQSRQTKYAIAWVLLASLSAWLNLPAIIIVTSPFLYFGISALRRIAMDGQWNDFLRLITVGAVMLVLMAILLGPPLITQPGALMAKAGQHYINWSTLPWAVSLASGSGKVMMFVALMLISMVGFVRLWLRDSHFSGYILVSGLFSLLVLIVTGAAYALHGNVFLRYLIGLVPFYLAFAAVGLSWISSQLLKRAALPATCNVLLTVPAVLLLIFTGPLPDWPIWRNQFVMHQTYHFHYDWQQNLYRVAMKDWYRAEPFYEEIAAAHDPGEALIIEAAWHMESYSNALNLQQDAHKQRVQIGFVNGLCAGPLFGEITAGQAGMNFRNFVYLEDILYETKQADYLVLRHRGMPASARKIDMDFQKCEQAVRDKFGEPWRQSEFALVFRITQHE